MDDILDVLVAHGVPGATIVRVAKLIADAQQTEGRRDRNRERMQTVRTHARTGAHTETQKPDMCKEVRSKKVRKKETHTLASDWKPSDQDRAYARTKGWPEQRIDNEAERLPALPPRKRHPDQKRAPVVVQVGHLPVREADLVLVKPERQSFL